MNKGRFSCQISEYILIFLAGFVTNSLHSQTNIGVLVQPLQYSFQDEAGHYTRLLSTQVILGQVGQKEWARRWRLHSLTIGSEIYFPSRWQRSHSTLSSARWNITAAMDFRIVDQPFWAMELSPVFGIVWMPDQANPETAGYRRLGSQLNNVFALALQNHFPLTKRLHLTSQVQVNHISNGGRVQPNLGLNYITAGAGLQYQLKPLAQEKPNDPSRADPKNILSISSGFAWRSVNQKREGHWLNIWKLNYQYRWLEISGWTFSVDYQYLIKSTKKQSGWQEELPGFTGTALGASTGMMLHFDDFKIIGQFGRYVWTSHKAPFDYYQNLGFEYKCFHSLSLTAHMRLHQFDTADYMVFGIAYQWDVK